MGQAMQFAAKLLSIILKFGKRYSNNLITTLVFITSRTKFHFINLPHRSFIVIFRQFPLTIVHHKRKATENLTYILIIKISSKPN